MAERVFFLNKLREGIDREHGDRFLREHDIPMGRSLKSITTYTVARIEGTVEGDGPPPFDYLDVLEVTSVAEYRAEIAGLAGDPEWESFVTKWSSHIGESVAVYGEVLD